MTLKLVAKGSGGTRMRLMQFVYISNQLSNSDPDKVERKRLIEIAHIIFGAHNLLHPFHINTTMRGTAASILRHSASQYWEDAPTGNKTLMRLLDVCMTHFEAKITQARAEKWMEKERLALAWRAHDLIMTMDPFRDGTGRTARFVLAHVCYLLFVPLPDLGDRKKYFKHVKTVRPLLQPIITRIAAELANPTPVLQAA